MIKVSKRGLWLMSATGVLAIGTLAQASLLYSGGTYSESFDSLPNTPTNTNLQVAATPMKWQDDTTASTNIISIPGWYLWHPTDQSAGEGGTNGHQRFRNSSGNSNTGSFYSFGANSTTDRALGDVGSNTLTPTPPTTDPDGVNIYIALRLTNNTPGTLTSFTLDYNGEQWRDGGATTPAAQGMTFGWSTTATAVSDPSSAFNSVATLGFNSPVFTNTASGAAVDGNTAGRVAVAAVTVTGLNWAPGTDLWLRWTDINHNGNDHGLAIDDLHFSATPEPSTIGLLVLGSTLLARRRRMA